MANKKYLEHLDIQVATAVKNPGSNFIALGALADGLYQNKAGVVSRLATMDDIHWDNLTGVPTTLEGFGITGGTVSDSITSYNFNRIIGANGSGDAHLELWRGTNASWRMLNSGGNLRFQSNYTTVVGSYYDVLTLNYNTGNASLKGALTASSFVKSGGSSTDILMADGSTLGISSANAYALAGIANKIPIIKSDGVMEVGKYIDFHESASSDYTTRLISENGVFKINNAKLSVPSTASDALQVSGGASITGSMIVGYDLSVYNTLSVEGSLSVFATAEFQDTVIMYSEAYHNANICLQNASYENAIYSNGNQISIVKYNNWVTKSKLTLTDTGIILTGNTYCTGELAAYSTSDERLKTNVRSINNGLDVICRLAPVAYNWNKKAKELNPHKTDARDFGLIAQQLEQVLPELVHESSDGYKSVDYVKIIPYLIAGMKEQQTQIELLTNKLEKHGITIK
ncbi:tail fiber domain-containing protein [Bacteroides sedimenti]|uniref:Peptidase S74 domain-containing protein n=1 Tax=Bacteroides sedimenti TaxID=2136147 RepID=A0ABN6Z0I9_9BACE